MNYFIKKSGLLLPIILLSHLIIFAQKKTKLFLPDKKNEWHIFIDNSPKDVDSNNVFVFEKNILHASGQRFGYLVTEKKYADFHFTVEFKWGEKKYPPRENQKRDGGILYHVDLYSGDKIWPRSIEFQIQEGDCGDFWMTDSTTIIHNDTLTPPKNWYRAAKSANAEKPNGQWNKAEVIVQNGNITHLLNGIEVNRGKLSNTKQGFIILQSEGAEIYYRNAEIEELK